MATKTKARPNEGQGEYIIKNGSSGQEWILDAYRALEPRNYVKEFTSQNVRPDGRPYHTARPITVLTSFLKRNSHGSAMITLGNTRVMAACTLLVGHPGNSTPTHGDFDVLFTASPLSGPRFDIMGRESVDSIAAFYNYPHGKGNTNNTNSDVNGDGCDRNYDAPQPTDTKEIESWIRRTLRSSRFIDPRELGIEPGKSAWRVRISIHVINHDGNLWDAALLCACAALGDLKLPMVEVNRRDGGVRIVGESDCGDDAVNGKSKVVQRKKGRSLTLGPLPVPLTIAILPNGNTTSQVLLVDPTHLEEDVSSGNIVTVVCNAREEIVEFHKKGSGSRITVEQMTAVASMGFGRAKELEPLVVGDR